MILMCVFKCITELLKMKSKETEKKAKAGTRNNKQEMKGVFILRTSAKCYIL